MSSRPFSFLALLFSLALTYTPGVRLAADETPPDSVRGVVHLFPDSPRFLRHFSIRLEARTGCLSPIVADLDGDGTAALMTMTSEGTLEDPARRLATATDGRPHARDPVLGSNPLVGDVDGGGGEEIVSLNVGTRLWEITAPDETGEIRTTATDCSANQLGENVVLGDWDGDGRDELGVVRAAGEWTVASIRAPGCPTRPVPIWPLPNLRPIGVGDFAGDGHGQPVFSNVERDSWFVVDLRGARPTAPRAAWAELQGIAVDSAAAVGDFTGDGRSDLVIWSGSTLYGWWLAASIGETAIELPITGLPNLDGRPLRRLVGVRDLTGDGVDDLLLQHEDCETTVYSLEPGDPLPGVSVSGDATSVQTGTDGTFEFAAGSLGPLAAIKAGYLVLPRHVQPRVPSGAIARFVEPFAAHSLRGDPRPVHLHRVPSRGEREEVGKSAFGLPRWIRRHGARRTPPSRAALRRVLCGRSDLLSTSSRGHPHGRRRRRRRVVSGGLRRDWGATLPGRAARHSPASSLFAAEPAPLSSRARRLWGLLGRGVVHAGRGRGAQQGRPPPRPARGRGAASVPPLGR
jgi:hypothetical protein